MNCKCGEKAFIKLLEGFFCEKCFKQKFRKKVLNELRGSLPSHSTICFDESTPGGKVASEVIKPFALKARNRIIQRKAELNVLGDVLEDKVLDIMENVINGKELEEKKGFVKPLIRCSEKEANAYAKLQGIELPEWPEEKGLRKTMKEEIALMEEKHPGTKYSILSSGEYLKTV